MKEVKAYNQCLDCIHREVCKYMDYWEILQKALFFHDDDITEDDIIKANCILVNRLFKVSIMDGELLKRATLLANCDCPKFKKLENF